MLPKSNATINQVITQSNSNYVNIARTAFYIEVFEGSIYDWKGAENSGITPVWNKHLSSKIHVNIQQGQSRTCSATLPLSDFRTGSTGYLNYNFDTGIYTNKINPANSATWLHLSKGYILRGYVGYKDFEYPYADNVVRRFTGIIDSIVVNDNDGTLEVNAVDFSAIFMGSLNYNYPDINSYRDMAPIPTSLVLPASILSTDASPLEQTFPSSAHGLVMGDKIKINSEIFMVINVAGAVVQLQRFANPAAHSAGAPIYLMDGLIVGPEDVYDNRLLSKYVPAYDNWRLTDAVRDICIKAKFPTDMLSFSFSDKPNMRLGSSEKYPFMKSKTIFETMKQKYVGPNRSFTSESYDSNGQLSYESKIEKKVYLGLDDEALNEAKFKFEFGKTLWDCIVTMCEGFGFRVYFDDDGNLTIKAVRQYTWSRPAEETDEDYQYIENHCWFWKYWDITLKTDKRYSIDFSTITDKPYVIKARFISKEAQTNPMEIKLQYKRAGVWENYSDVVVIPSLQPYQFYEALLFTRNRDTTAFEDGEYGVLKVNSFSDPPMFNGFLYLDTLDETISYDVDSRYNAQVGSQQNTATDVRNQMTIIGQPKAPLPIVSRVQDTASMYGGMSCLAMITENSTNYLRGDRNNFFIDGKYDTYAALKTLTGTVTLKTMSLEYNIKRVILFLKPQTTPLGTTISFFNGATQIATHDVVQDDLGSGGCVFIFPAAYAEVIITADIDLEISEIECYDDTQAYNFVGFKKETLVVKANASDKATTDWMAYTQLEMHRKNTKTISFTSLGNPYLEMGDCLTIAAPEVGAYFDTKLWTTGISIEASLDSYIDTVTISAIPPMQSYMLPPAPDGNVFPPNDAYDFSISKYKVGVQGDIPTTTPYNVTSTVLAQPLGVDDLYLSVNSVTGFVVGLIRITWGSWVEFIQITSIDSLNNRLNITSRADNRGKNNTIVKAGWPAVDTAVEQFAVVADFTGGDHFLTFNFALPVSKKVQILVGVRHINQTMAYVMEEKVLTAGVYKRENGIRWDGGLNFAKVWPESVDKMYLPPNESFNYMYNRMFNPNAKAAWEDPNYNYYWWNFDQDLVAQYGYGTSGNATSSGWTKTPYQFNATLVVKPVLAGYTGPTTNIPAISKSIDIKTKCPMYKLVWGELMPVENYLSQFPVISCSVKIEKIFNSVTTTSELNDAVYFDTYVMKADGGNVNITGNQGQDTPRRWISPIALVSMLTWDFTDSQGQFVPAVASPTFTGYKFGIVNAFDIYGEGVEVKKGGLIPDNLLDGSMKPFKSIYSDKGIDYSATNTVISGTWSVQSSYVLAPELTRNTNNWPGVIVPDMLNSKNVFVKHSFPTSGGQQENPPTVTADPYLRIEFRKGNKVKAWERKAEKLFYVQSSMTLNYKPTTAQMYFRFFYKPFTKPNMFTPPQSFPIDPTHFSLDQLFNPYMNITYNDKYGAQKEYSKKVSFATETAGSWYSGYITFNIADLTDCDIIKGLALEFRPCDLEAPSDLLITTWTDPLYIGLDSFELSIYTGTPPAPVYLEPSGGVRISNIFKLYT